MFHGFTDNNSYYIRAKGQTEQLTEIDTGFIVLSTQFNARNIYTQFSLENNACDGYITINSHVISLDGVTNPDPPIYIDNKELDLTSEGSYVTWEKSFGIYETYTARFWFRKPTPDSILATIYSTNNPNTGITIYEHEEEVSGTTYLWVDAIYIDNYGFSGYIISNKIEKPNDSTTMMIWLQKYNGLYDISIAEVEE